MASLRPGWATDLAILRLSGSVVTDFRDHLVVRTPDNPQFHWGNFVLVTDERRVDDAAAWVGVFEGAFPGVGWVSIGLPRLPDDTAAWEGHGMTLEVDEVLTTAALPRLAPLADGYTVRRLAGDDWALAVARSVADNARTGKEERDSFASFARRRTRARRTLSEGGFGAWFGAFAGDALVADLGIVRCGTAARYQDVSTDEAHRGRGLASHLLGVAARWAAGAGCGQWVIVTEAESAAGRLYRSLGFGPDTANVLAYRRPGH
jgi:GNAT superfamily N-acetyltransferase